MSENREKPITVLLVFFVLWVNGSTYPLILLLFVFTRYHCGESLSRIGIGRRRLQKSLILGLLAGFLVLMAYYPISILYRGVRAAPIPGVWSMLNDIIWYPLYEEVSYRGFFLGFLAKEGGDFSRHDLGLNLLQSLLFVLVQRNHVSAKFPFLLIPVLLLGFLNGLVFLRSRNVTGCIVGHAIVNGTAWLMQTWIS